MRSGIHLHTEWPLAIIYQKNIHSVIYIRGETARRLILSILPPDLQPSPFQLLYIQSSPTISPVSLYQLVPLYTS